MSTTTADTINNKPTLEQLRNKPAIYWAFWHPHKTFVDILIGFLMSFLLPLTAVPKKLLQDEAAAAAASKNKNKLRKEPPAAASAVAVPDVDVSASIKHAKKQRETLNKMVVTEAIGKNGCYRKLAKAIGCNLIETTLHLPRQDGLLTKWNIGMPDNVTLPPKGTVTIHVAFPETLLPDGVNKPTEYNDVGCLSLKDDDDILGKLIKTVPTILFFHGGGFVIGNCRMNEGIDLLLKVLEGDEAATATRKEFIWVAVDYSLAPENPFPIPPLEACSVTAQFLEAGFEHVHLYGVSAGAAHALVAGLETYRAKVGNNNSKAALKSVLALCPMLNPACDSVSYYQNSTSSHMVPISWLHWCYQIYLQLPEVDDDDEKKEPEDDNSLEYLLGQGTNRRAWQASKWSDPTKGIRRWAEPIFDLPKFDNSDDNNVVPKFIFTTNAGDPLLDDGVAMVNALKEKAGASKVSHHAHPGSHYVGSVIDQNAYSKVAEEWGKILFVEAEANNEEK